MFLKSPPVDSTENNGIYSCNHKSGRHSESTSVIPIRAMHVLRDALPLKFLLVFGVEFQAVSEVRCVHLQTEKQAWGNASALRGLIDSVHDIDLETIVNHWKEQKSHRHIVMYG